MCELHGGFKKPFDQGHANVPDLFLFLDGGGLNVKVHFSHNGKFMFINGLIQVIKVT